MKKLLLTAVAAAGLSTGASATTIINENFQSGYGVFQPSGNVSLATGANYQPCCGTTGNTTNQFVAFGSGNQASGSIMSTSFNTSAGKTYTLTFDYGALGRGTDPLFVTAGGTTFSVSPTANNNLDTTFKPFTYSFAGTGGPSELRFQSGGVNDADAILDNVRLVATVPEPATWAMMILGFGIVGTGLRRRPRPTLAHAR